MDIIKIIEIILSSSLLVAIVKNIFHDKDLIANNIAKTRIESDNTRIMKKSLDILYNDKNEGKKLEWIPKIKRCLNPYYYHDFNLDSEIPISLNNEDVEHDVLIWYVITKIDSLAGTKNKKTKYRNKYMKALPSLIAASIKFDWDRYQSETSSKYKKDYKYNYYVAVKRICVSNCISEDFKFAPYKPECDISKLRHYIIIVLPIISYLFFKCLTHRCWFIISCIVILLLGVCGIIIASTALYQEVQHVKVKQSVDDIECAKNKSNENQEYFAREKDYKWIDLFILIFYCLIILQMLWQIIPSNIMEQNCLKNCVKTIIEILKKII